MPGRDSNTAREVEQKSTLDFESTRRQFEFAKTQDESLKEEVTATEANRARELDVIKGVEAQVVAMQESIRGLTSELAASSLDEVQEQVTYWTTRAGSLKRRAGGSLEPSE